MEKSRDSPRRETDTDYLAVERGRRELVSRPFSLFPRENTGKSSKTASLGLFSQAESDAISGSCETDSLREKTGKSSAVRRENERPVP